MIRGVIAAFLLLVCAGGLAAADDGDPKLPPASYPKLLRHALSVEALHSAGWRLEITKSGDLNGDGRPDAVLVLRDIDPENFIDSGQQNTPKFDTNPRILAVAFANAKGGYDLVLENHTLDRAHDRFVAAGSARSRRHPGRRDRDQERHAAGHARIFRRRHGPHDLTFRYQNKRFELIGYDRVNVTRNSGVMTDTQRQLFDPARANARSGTFPDDKNKIDPHQIAGEAAADDGAGRRWPGISGRCRNDQSGRVTLAARPSRKAVSRLLASLSACAIDEISASTA